MSLSFSERAGDVSFCNPQQISCSSQRLICLSLCFPNHPCFADDHSRVRLQPLEGEQSSDYINANYVDVSTRAGRGGDVKVSDISRGLAGGPQTHSPPDSHRRALGLPEAPPGCWWPQIRLG